MNMNTINKILAVCRITSQCGFVVQTAAAQARLHNAELIILHVVHNPFGIEGWNLPMPALTEDYTRLMKRTRKELSERLTEAKQEPITVDGLVREGKPVREILKVVEEKKIDLLILPAHSESRLEHLLFGGDNEELIREMPCSIMLVKREPKQLEDDKLAHYYDPALAVWK